jgi:voltage-gated sodium channel
MAESAHDRRLSKRAQFDIMLRKFYKSPKLQYSLFAFVSLNFLINCLNFELLPEPDSMQQSVFDWIDLAFTVVFSAELALNFYVSGLRRNHFSSGFNLLDLIIIALSWMSYLIPSMQNVSVLRLFRVARVVRVARRMTSLITLASSISGAVLPIANTFFVILMVSGLYSVLCVMLFQDSDPTLFGKWSLALFTLFQVSSGDGWVQTVVRPMMRDDDGSVKDGIGDQLFPVLFFISYYLIISIVLFNIVVAILLDEFMQV